MAAMALVPLAARRPLRVTETRAALGLSKTILAAIGLALAGPASALSPNVLKPFVWAVAAFLFWRLWAQLRAHDDSDTDAISGFLETRAFSRHVAGVVQAASSANPAIVVAVDLDGFGRWNAQNGYGAGDALLTGVASRLEASPLAGGIWSRLAADRFAWIGIGHDASSARHLAEVVCGVAADNLGELGARATFVDPARRRHDRRERDGGRGRGARRGQGRATPGGRVRPRPAGRRGLLRRATPPRSRNGARPSSRSSAIPARSPRSSSPSSRSTTAAPWASRPSHASAPSPSARRTSGSARPTPSASGSRSRSSACVAPAAIARPCPTAPTSRST